MLKIVYSLVRSQSYHLPCAKMLLQGAVLSAGKLQILYQNNRLAVHTLVSEENIARESRIQLYGILLISYKFMSDVKNTCKIIT